MRVRNADGMPESAASSADGDVLILVALVALAIERVLSKQSNQCWREILGPELDPLLVPELVLNGADPAGLVEKTLGNQLLDQRLWAASSPLASRTRALRFAIVTFGRLRFSNSAASSPRWL